MRLKLCRALIGGVLAIGFAGAVPAQNPDTMDPGKSAAKANQVLSQLLEAMGGQRFLGARGSECSGKLVQFGHNGEMMGFADFHEYWQYPDKKRTDIGKKGNIIDLFAGEEGWTLDRGGVSEEPATVVGDFQEALKRSVSNFLRTRLHEPGMLLRWGGLSVVDLRQADWVEITDTDDRVLRIAVDRETHLPVRSVATIRDEESGEKREEVTLYSNYQTIDGVAIPKQVSRQRDGRRTAQVFYDSCQLNPNLPPDFFTKAALEKRFAEVGGKKKK